MNVSRWEKAKEFFAAARKLTPELRLPYLLEVCAGDVELRREVETLLASYDDSEDFLESPAIGEVADAIYQTNRFGKGKFFGHLEIVEQIGAGGAGEVYLAADKKLNRLVAVKILNDRFARHESNLERFIREAQTASALNHPNILIVHEIGVFENTHFIVTEFIEGKTLREILNEKSLALSDVLDVAIQIANALRVAHETNLIHRDIKPENIMIRNDKIVKVLDFGLAKLIGQHPSESASESFSRNETAEGVIMGTINYMSPEQTGGKPIDFRSDIFSFGIVLYEMLTGKNPFRGETFNHTIIAILENQPPPLSRFISNFPSEIETIINKCLEKDPANRYDSAKELLNDLKAVEKKLNLENELERSAPPNNTLDLKSQNSRVETTIEIQNPVPNNLTENIYPIIGRENEIREIKSLLERSDVRLLTLTGIGGVGKTRLAKAIAGDLLNDFSDGVFFIELAAITNEELVVSAIAQPLGLQEGGGKSLREILREFLGNRKMLFVLDNFEQIMNAAPQIGDLLAASQIKILITSRTILRLSKEVEFSVPPLAVPTEIREFSQNELADFEAVKLFVERARKAKPHFNLTAENVKSVAEICARLDGLPLAIELAAARMKILAPQTILAKLEHRLQLLTSGARDLPERQQTMRGAIEWSFDLLNEAEKSLFSKLSVFHGGFTFEAAEIVCVGNEFSKNQIDFLNLLTSLTEKSLLAAKEQSENDEPRFRMLEIVCEYALESLETNRQADEIRRRHALYFLQFTEKAELHLHRIEAEEWLGRLESEHDNLRAALSWSFEFEPEIAARLTASLRLFWNYHGHFAEGRRWLEKSLVQMKDISLDTLWKIYNGVGNIANLQGDFQSGRKFLEKCRETAILANNDRQIALSNQYLSWTLAESGSQNAAKILLEESLSIGRELNDREIIAQSLLFLGEWERSKEKYAEARRNYEESLDYYWAIDKKNSVAILLTNLGTITYLQNDLENSYSFYKEALKLSLKLGYKLITSICLDGFAALNFKQNEPESAVKLSAAAEKLREMIGYILEKEDRRFREDYLSELKNKLDETAFSELYEQGRKLKPEKAFALALSSNF